MQIIKTLEGRIETKEIFSEGQCGVITLPNGLRALIRPSDLERARRGEPVIIYPITEEARALHTYSQRIVTFSLKELAPAAG